MNNNIEDTFDEPRTYKGIKLYPVIVKNYYTFFTYVQSLTLDKNSIPDAKIISMSYLEYLYHLYKEKSDNALYVVMLDKLLKLCLKLPDDTHIDYDYDNKGRPFVKIGDNVFFSDDFDEIKKIIFEQNLVEVENENYSKEARDAIENARKYREKINNSGRKMASFEDQMICVLISTNLSLDDIYNLTIRKFIKIIQRVELKMHYQIYLQASLSGFVEFKDKSVIQHWMTEINKDKYKDVLMDEETINKKAGKGKTKINNKSKNKTK